MDQARRLAAATLDMPSRARSRSDDRSQIGRIEKVLHVAFPGREGAAAAEAPAASTGRDFASAIEIVREAAQSIRAAELRAAEAEERMDELVQRATEELRAAELRIQRSDDRARAAESRAAEAEGRLREAEDWLDRIYEVIAQELPQRPGDL